jgi:hypothetical protein
LWNLRAFSFAKLLRAGDRADRPEGLVQVVQKGRRQGKGIAMDVEAMAHAMFSAYHAHYGRFRDWKRAPMQDVGPEMGKQTFLLMAQAVADMPAPEVEATVDGESY